MLLYHGTSERHLQAIREGGLQPRGARGSVWKVPSRHDLVYLTDGAYAVHFARAATENGDERHLILEVETDKLHASRLLPDEDCLEQATRGVTRKRDGAPVPPKSIKTMEARTAWFRERLHLWSHGEWAASIRALGTCAYRGTVPVSAVTRACLIDPTHPLAMWYVDPTITLFNHQIMGAQYRAMARWLMGEEVAPADILLIPLIHSESYAAAEKVLANREGWQMVTLTTPREGPDEPATENDAAARGDRQTG